MQMAENLGVELDLRDVNESEEALAELMERTGEQQVPFLVDIDRNVAMLESSEIIEYLRENYARSSSGSVASKPRVHVGGSTCISCEG
jgi:glutathione S-transferase